MIELVLPLPTPSLNRQFGHHWSKRAKLRKQWAWMVRAERMRLGRYRMSLAYTEGDTDDSMVVEQVHRMTPASVTLNRYGPRLLDYDNFVAGAKQLIDALVAEGFLVDDSPAHLQVTYRQHVGKPYRTEVRIE